MRRIIGSSLSLLFLITLLVGPLVAATDHVGRVTLSGGTPVPGARVTATQGSPTLPTTTDAQGAYRLPALADGTWSSEVGGDRSPKVTRFTHPPPLRESPEVSAADSTSGRASSRARSSSWKRRTRVESA